MSGLKAGFRAPEGPYGVTECVCGFLYGILIVLKHISSWGWKNCPFVGIFATNPHVYLPDSSSVITEFLRAQFTTGNIGVACVYLNHKEADSQSCENILASLWRQLIFRKPLHSGSPAHTLYDMHYEKRTSPTLEEMHTLLRSAVAEYSKVYFIIDALDEYPEIQRYSLLKRLTTFGAEVNLLLTSRPHIKPDIFFPNTPSLEVQAAEEDICRYVDAQIQNSPRLSNHVQSCPELHQEIETKIISHMDGM
jgi:hypothetical protein